MLKNNLFFASVMYKHVHIFIAYKVKSKQYDMNIEIGVDFLKSRHLVILDVI